MNNILFYCPKQSMAEYLYDFLITHNYPTSTTVEKVISRCGKRGILIAIDEDGHILYGQPPLSDSLKRSWNCVNYTNNFAEILRKRGFIS